MSDQTTQVEAMRVLGESFKQFEDKMVAAFSIFVDELNESFLPAIKRFYDALYQAYIDHGAIYGETPEGCYRWLRELAEINGLRAEAEYIENRQLAIADFKRQAALKKRG